MLIKGVLKIIPEYCHLFEMETSCKWHFPSVCDHSTLPSLRPQGPVQVPTLSPSEHLGQDDLDAVMRVEGFRDVSTWLRPAGWSKQCQDWPLQKAWAHQFHPSWLAGMSHLLQARLAPNQRPTLSPWPPGSPVPGFGDFRAGAVPGTREALNYTLVE